MKKIAIALLMFSSTMGYGQDYQKEINEQVWKPFTRAIMNQDVEAFASLHSPEMIRVERNGKKIFGLAEYRKNMETGWPGWKDSLKKNQITYTFELRFIERVNNGEFAYEVGYFKNESLNPSGEKRVGYGKFHVTLRKESGAWKILVDSDSNEGGSITEEIFQAAKSLE